MATSRDPSRCGVSEAGDGGTANGRAVSYTRWCEPAGYRPDGLSGCLCASTSRSGDCGAGRTRPTPTDPQVAGAEAPPSSVARSSSEIAPSLSQIPK